MLAVKELIALDTGIRSLFTIFWVGSDNEKGVSVGPVVFGILLVLQVTTLVFILKRIKKRKDCMKVSQRFRLC